ncbi:MAG TPA: energy-coupling factor ABC transporter permease [Bacillota bacterium]|nr:energy-coupling factor ABC transporter permease [Bacillota bacterium]
MHMVDALISPMVGGTMWATTAGLMAYSAKKLQTEHDDKKVPLMGVLGAFIFAAQMINFSIPLTGSSGHLGGGLILAILLGPYAGFLAMASVLVIQALFFADGGLLALGCNIFNMGFWTCFVAYPLIYKKIVRNNSTRRAIFWGTMAASIVGLQLGAFSVVLETFFSGISALPFKTFVLWMQPIHLAIGIVEGLITAAVVSFVWKARPEIVDHAALTQPIGKVSNKGIIIGILIVTLITGGALSWFASASPDGLEWSMLHTSGRDEMQSKNGLHQTIATVQKKTAIMPEYDFRRSLSHSKRNELARPVWPAVNGGTSMSGILGATLIIILIAAFGYGLKWIKKRS